MTGKRRKRFGVVYHVRLQHSRSNVDVRASGYETRFVLIPAIALSDDL
jgi:hypothetical protein